MDFQRLPKLDLHLHIDGAVRTGTILDLAREQNHPLPANSVEELDQHVRVGPNCRSLTEFLATFEVFYDLLKLPDALERVTRELCEDLQADGVRYAELRFAPILNVRDLAHSKTQMRDMIAAALRGLRAALSPNFSGNLILCCYRGFDTEYALETVELAAEFHEEFGNDGGIAAVDLAGDESRYPAAAFRGPFDLARDCGLPITIHAAEAAGPESARDALDLLHAKRIGHGIRIREDGELLARVRDGRIPLEVCLTSNLQTQTVGSLAEHPFTDYLDQGLCVTINTDDPRVSGITLSSEWELAQRSFHLDDQQLRQVARNCVEAAFCTDAVRAQVREQIEAAFVTA